MKATKETRYKLEMSLDELVVILDTLESSEISTSKDEEKLAVEIIKALESVKDGR